MSRAGFLLTGGNSRRMGRDKALLPFRGGTLAGHLAGILAAAAGSATLIGDPARYASLGFPVISDHFHGAGPLAGIDAALDTARAEWNLVLACDMPLISEDFLAGLLEAAEKSGGDCLLPAGPSGEPEPLCAVYHARCRQAVRASLESGIRKVRDGIAGCSVCVLPVDVAKWFRNCNTPEDWAELLVESGG